MKYLSKIKKIVVSALLAVCLLLVCVGVTACKGNDDSKSEAPTLFGFEVGETITVNQYSLVLPVNVHVSDAEGTMYDVVVKVRDSKGNVISTDEGNKFNAYDANGYTITYTIETWEFTISKEVKVVVNSATENLEFEIKCDSLVSVGEMVDFQVEGDITNPEYTVSVVHKETGVACPTNGLSFQTSEVGKHTLQVKVVADEGTATKSMEIYAREPLQEGEVEVFGEDWLTVREFSSRSVGMEGKWSVATTADTGIKDADGNDGTYAVLETNAEYTHIYFGIRESRAYYRELAMKGYTHVRFRIYVDSPTNRGKLFNWEHNVNDWRTSLGSAKAGCWTEFYIPLASGVAGTSDKKPGFIESYEYYLSRWILLMDNSNGNWNANGRDVDEDGNPLSFKVYFDDIFAVRRTYETTISTTENKDVYDLSSMLECAWGTNVEDYTYSIIKHTANGTQQTELINNAALKSNRVVDLSALQNNHIAYGSYEVRYFIKGGDTEIPYRRIWVNVLDSSFDVYGVSARGMIWRYQDATAKVRANEDGTMVYTASGSWGAGLQIAPTYDLSYYNSLKNEGYALTFDLKLDVEFSENVSNDVKATTFTVASFYDKKINYQNGETHTVTISMANIISYFQHLQNVALGSDTNEWAKHVLFYFSYDDTVYSVGNHKQITFTISNLQMVKQV